MSVPFVDGGGRFILVGGAQRPPGATGNTVLTAVDVENSYNKVAIKLFKNECDRDATVQVLKELHDALYMITFADPNKPEACVFNAAGHLYSEAPYAVALQYASKSLELLEASEEGDLAKVRRLLRDANTNPNATNIDGDTPLHWASWNGHTEVVKALLAAGAVVGAKGEYGNTPLDRAKESYNTEVVRVLESYKK